MAVRRQYNPTLATPETLEAMRFWIHNELQAVANGMQAGFSSSERRSLEFFTAAGYGGINQGSSVGISDISAAFQTLPADTLSVANPRGVSGDLVDDGLIFDFPGVWQINIALTLEFVDINAGRTLEVRLQNITNPGSPASSTIFVGRNQAGLNFSPALLLDIPLSVIGDTLVLQVGAASTDFTGVTLHTYSFDAVHVSELASFEAP
jgi:hypothetical protein